MRGSADFHLTLDRSAGLTLDATCAARAAIALPVPAPHRRLVTAAIRKLEGAQQDLYNASRHPWEQAARSKPRQLELL